MFKLNHVRVWVGIILLSGMFLMGQETWPPQQGERIVFVTESTHTGNLGGLEGADAICQSEADAAGLSGTFMAWFSDSTHSPSTRFSRAGGPFVLVNGTVIATDWSDLTDGNLLAPISLTASGAELEGWAWTGTTAEGQLDPYESTCDAWQSTVYPFQGWFGTTTYTNMYWTYNDGISCSVSASLYCFQQ